MIVKVGLEQRGYQVRSESDPRQALNAAKAFMPDLIILDIMMPGKDGGDVAAEIRNGVPQGNKIPIIFLTSLMEKDKTSRKEGATASEIILGKPVNVDKLTELIEKSVA